MYNNYITKKHLSQDFPLNKLIFFNAPMGSGKTTLIKELLEEELSLGKKCLVITPYITAKSEYGGLNLEDTEEFEFEEKKTKVKDEEFYAPLVVSYLPKIVDYVKRNSKRLDTFIHNFQVYIDTFDFIIIDEIDFLFTQAQMESRTLLYNREKGLYQPTIEIIYVAVLTMIAKSNVGTIAISANNIPDINDDVLDKASHLINSEILTNYIHKVNLDIKSNIHLKSLKIVNIKGKDSETVAKYHTRYLKAIIKNIKEDETVILFSKNRWKPELLKAGAEMGAKIYARKDNLNFQLSDKEIVGYHLKDLPAYKNVRIIGESKIPVHKNKNLGLSSQELKLKDDNLSDNSFLYDNNIVMCNLSSSRAVSLVKNYKKARVIVFIDKMITAGDTQIIGRFRKSGIDVLIVLNNLSENWAYMALRNTDMHLFKTVKVETYSAKNMKEFNDLGIGINVNNKGDKKGKAISYSTNKRREDCRNFFINHPIKGSIRSYFREYLGYMDYLECDIKYALTPFQKAYSKFTGIKPEKKITKTIKKPKKEAVRIVKEVKKSLNFFVACNKSEESSVTCDEPKENQKEIDKQSEHDCRNYFINHPKAGSMSNYFKEYLEYMDYLESEVRYSLTPFQKAYKTYIDKKNNK